MTTRRCGGDRRAAVRLERVGARGRRRGAGVPARPDRSRLRDHRGPPRPGSALSGAARPESPVSRSARSGSPWRSGCSWASACSRNCSSPPPSRWPASSGGPRSPSAPNCRGRRRRCDPSCSSTPSPAAARRRSSRWPPKPARAESSRSNSVPPGISSGSYATRSPAAPTGSRWPAETARRRSSPRSPRSSRCRTRASPRAPATTSRSTSASTATTSSAALDAFVDGGERRVDLAEVNGRVFVNNVSLGLYADAVQQDGYREAKLRTILDTVPDMLGPDATGLDLRWTGPGGHEHRSGAAILVSNNRYRLGRAVGSGTRPTDRRRAARHHRRRSTHRRRRARTPAAATVARVDRAALQGRFRPPRARRHRRRSRQAGAAAALSHPRRRPARTHRAPAPWRLALGKPPRGPQTERPRTRPDRRRTLARPFPTKGRQMDIFEIEQKETLSREEVAARLAQPRRHARPP